jgi:hypothetical protein
MLLADRHCRPLLPGLWTRGAQRHRPCHYPNPANRGCGRLCAAAGTLFNIPKPIPTFASHPPHCLWRTCPCPPSQLAQVQLTGAFPPSAPSPVLAFSEDPACPLASLMNTPTSIPGTVSSDGSVWRSLLPPPPPLRYWRCPFPRDMQVMRWLYSVTLLPPLLPHKLVSRAKRVRSPPPPRLPRRS